MTTTDNSRTIIGKALRNRWFGALVAGVSLVTAAVYLLRDRPKVKLRHENAVDDRGTGQYEALQLLRNLRDRAFDADNGKLALALGRPEEEVRAWDTGEVIDDDVVMKARGIALHRGVAID